MSLVNEMLVQIESFQGIFIASTNLVETLDSAVLRRFDMKIKFDFLNPGQSWGLFLEYCAFLGLNNPTTNLESEMSRIGNLTPGDFAVIARQSRLHQFDSPESVLAALKRECAMKGQDKQRIGFI